MKDQRTRVWVQLLEALERDRGNLYIDSTVLEFLKPSTKLKKNKDTSLNGKQIQNGKSPDSGDSI